MKTVAEIKAERAKVATELDKLAEILKPLLAKRGELRRRDHSLRAGLVRAEAKERIKALGKRRRVWLRRHHGDRLPYGMALTTLRFGPKNCSVRVANGPHKGDEWRIPYADLAIKKPSQSEVEINRGLGDALNQAFAAAL